MGKVLQLKTEGMHGYVAFDKEHLPVSFIVERNEDDALESAKGMHPEVTQVVNALVVPLADLQRLFYITGIQVYGLQMMMFQARGSPIVTPQ